MTGTQKINAALKLLPRGTRRRILESQGMRTVGELASEWDTGSPDHGIFEIAHWIKQSLVEDDVMAYHVEFAEKEFGKDVHINLGWSVEDGCISSKIYGHGILTTWHDENGINDEQFEEFYPTGE